jgi:hypothetical protein
MKVSRILCLPAVAVLAMIVAAGQRTSDYRDPDVRFDAGWKSLFNGTNLEGWIPVLKQPDGQAKRYREQQVGEQSTFYVENGSLMTTGSPNGYVRTTDVYDNFVFHVEVRFSEAGNSGVLIHVQRDAVWPMGIECQLYQAHMGRVFPIQGAVLEGGEMIHSAANPPGEWNVYEVYSEEGRVASVLNGKLVGLGSGAEPSSGYICLQSEGVPAEFRNIKVRRYTPSWHMRKPRQVLER